MARIEPVDQEAAAGKAKELMDAVEEQVGMVPGVMRTMAQSPAVLEAYLGFTGALAGGRLSERLREQIALVVSQENRSGYCLAAHAAIGRSVGLTVEEIQESRQGISRDGKAEAALRFTRLLVEKRGWVSDEEFHQVREAGYSDGEIAEIVANVAQSLFTNYFNQVAGTAVDFPSPPALKERSPGKETALH